VTEKSSSLKELLLFFVPFSKNKAEKTGIFFRHNTTENEYKIQRLSANNEQIFYLERC